MKLTSIDVKACITRTYMYMYLTEQRNLVLMLVISQPALASIIILSDRSSGCCIIAPTEKYLSSNYHHGWH